MNPVYPAAREKLMTWATQGARMEELRAAKAEFFQQVGEVRDDEPNFEAWMDAFGDWYLCDRPLRGGPPPAQQFLNENGALLDPEEHAVFEAFTRTRRSLFSLEAVEEGSLRVRDLQTRERHDVVERRKPAGVEAGDIFDARLIPLPGGMQFTGGMIFHPSEVRRMVKVLASRARKEGPERFQAVMGELALRRLRVDRYRKLTPEVVYADLKPKRMWLPW
ncbi:MAG: hypothetical protein AB2A00_35880 [Myxococcota bacterium]